VKINKTEVLKALLAHFEGELSAIVVSAQTAHEAATHEESKAEDRHDTQAIEAGYLAQGVAVRVLEIKKVIAEYKSILESNFPAFNQVAPGCLVELEANGKISYSFFSHFGGGAQVVLESKTFTVLTPKSPLGESILGEKPGDEVEVETKGGLKHYTIVSIL
jgi:transcription elongation GreA/GreB family factor